MCGFDTRIKQFDISTYWLTWTVLSVDVRTDEWLMLKKNQQQTGLPNTTHLYPETTTRREGGSAELTSDTRDPPSLLADMWNYKPVKVRTSFNSTSKDKCWGEGIPQQGSISPALPHFPYKSQRGKVKRSHHCPPFTAPPFTPTLKPGLQLALKTLRSKSKACQCKAAELTGPQLRPAWLINIHLCKMLQIERRNFFWFIEQLLRIRNIPDRNYDIFNITKHYKVIITSLLIP